MGHALLKDQKNQLGKLGLCGTKNSLLTRCMITERKLIWRFQRFSIPLAFVRNLRFRENLAAVMCIYRRGGLACANPIGLY